MKMPKILKSRRKRIRELEADVKVLEGACRDWERTVEMLLVVNKSLDKDLRGLKRTVDVLKTKHNNETDKLRMEVKRPIEKNRKAECQMNQARMAIEIYQCGKWKAEEEKTE